MKEHSPTPWRVWVNRFGQCHVLAADDAHVDGPVGPSEPPGVAAANAAFIVEAANLKASIDNAMVDGDGFRHIVHLDSGEDKPAVLISPPPSESELLKMYKDDAVALLKDRERFQRGYYEALEECDRLRDLVRRVAQVLQDTYDFAEEFRAIIPATPGQERTRCQSRAILTALIREAREALGEGEP